MRFQFNDGGRARAGFKGTAPGDCVARSIAITNPMSYTIVAADLASRGIKKGRTVSAMEGVFTEEAWFSEYMDKKGYKWFNATYWHEIPTVGRIIVSMYRHYTSVIDGVIHDTFDPRQHRTTGNNPLSGYWLKV